MSETLNDAFEYVLGLVTADADKVISVQGKYEDDRLRDPMGTAAGVMLNAFSRASSDFRQKVAAGLRYGLTGDESFLQAAKTADNDHGPGQYL